MKRAIGIVLLLFLAGAAMFLLLKTPSNDRVWTEDLSKTVTASPHEDGTVTLFNVRDWRYGLREVKAREWLPSTTLNPETIVRVWFILEPFAKWEAVGHTYLTFEFENGEAYSFSVEARKEADEEYSALAGLFREYELAYTWGTERDFLTRRLLLLLHPVRMYPLQIDREAGKELFLTLVKKTNEVAERPRFYNTLTASCTNVLAEFANESSPNSIPYDISWNLPGFSDRFLARIGLIPELSAGAYDLTPYRDDIAEISEAPPKEFGEALRALIGTSGE